MTPRFTPISRQTVTASVRDALEQRIRTGSMRPGSPLPSERELAQQFDVARTSVREAVQGLMGTGLIVKKGNRSYVVERLPEVRLDTDDGRKLRVRELFTVRQILEPPITALAAEHATDAQREYISTLAAGFDEDMSLPAFRELDREFHLALAHSCGNELLAELSGKVLDSLFACPDFTGLLSAEENDLAVTHTISHSTAYHQSIAAAIRDRDGARGREEVIAHLADVEQRMTFHMT